jgi:hypothetical protein
VRTHAESKLEIIFQFKKGLPRLVLPSPIKGFIYLGAFHMTHLALFGMLTSVVIAFARPGLGVAELCAFVLLLAALYFFKPFHMHALYMNPRKHYLTWIRYKYLTNWEFIKGGLKRFVTDKVIVVEPSF